LSMSIATCQSMSVSVRMSVSLNVTTCRNTNVNLNACPDAQEGVLEPILRSIGFMRPAVAKYVKCVLAAAMNMTIAGMKDVRCAVREWMILLAIRLLASVGSVALAEVLAASVGSVALAEVLVALVGSVALDSVVLPVLPSVRVP